MSEELQEVINTNPEWYRDLQYTDAKGFIQDNINSTCRSFVAIGYYLKYIRDKKLYVLDGHESIWDLAQAEYGISKSQASKFMAINDKFSKDGNSPILVDKYKDFSSSKLAEMLYLTDEQIEQVKPATTVVEIREIRKPEEVVSTSKQETVPDINPDAKSVLDKLMSEYYCALPVWKKALERDIEEKGREEAVKSFFQYHAGQGQEIKADSKCLGYGFAFNTAGNGTTNIELLYADQKVKLSPDEFMILLLKYPADNTEMKPTGKCIHRAEFPCTLPEASKLAIGDGVNCNAKCCWGCERHKKCGYECNSSAQRPTESKFSIEEIVRYSVPHIDIHEELKRLCAYNFPGNVTKVMKLMVECKSSGNFAGKWSFAENGFTYTPSDTQQTKTISWDEYCEAFRRDNKHSIAYYISTKGESVNDDANSVIETEEMVIEDPESDTEGKSCSNCRYDIMSREEYFSEHPEAKEFPCDTCGVFNQWVPKIETKPEEDSEIHRPYLKGFMQDPYCRACGEELKYKQDCECGNKINWTGLELVFEYEEEQLKQETEQEVIEVVDADIIQTIPEDETAENEDDEEQDPETYTVFDIDTEMTALMQWLEEFRKDNSKAPARRKSKMRWDAICLLDKQVREANAPKDPKLEPQKQPELPILKNNDQRKDFIDAYETWPIWIDQKETGERYYRYDLTDKLAIVVKVSKAHIHRNYKETNEIDFSTEQYYLLGIKAEWHQTGVVFTEDKSRTFYECSSNKSALVDYLKYFQKKGVSQ